MLLLLLIDITVLLTVTAQHNLTPFGKATQSSQIGSRNGGPNNAINPPLTNVFAWNHCTITQPQNGNTDAWWMFEFFESSYVTEITIYYRNLDYRMDGFKVYVTNTSTMPPDGYLCYEDPDPGLPNITQTIPCYQLGKYVIYYDTKGDDIYGPIVELCYVAINGCPKSRWGSTCEKLCAENCIERNCYPENGSCIWGCNAKNCLNDICDKDTAVCTYGCKIRRTGIYCNNYNIASDSLVWQFPSGSQPANLANDGIMTSCSKTKGSSVTFQVDLKVKSIVTGLFILLGVGTTKEGHHTVFASNITNTWNSGIVLYNGTSLPTVINFKAVFRFLTYVPPVSNPIIELELCEIGIIGCSPSYYGPYCNTTCPQNCNGPCDLNIGQCTSGCMNGWIGNSCEQECSDGSYGKGCLEMCSVNCWNTKCNHVTGECIGGCKDGWQGFNCSQHCPNGQFGRNCSGFCDGCISRMCDHVKGVCDNTSSCNHGYKYSQYCNIACDDGNFGNNCAKRCYCLFEPCSKGDGICPPKGCKEGWYGESCNKECYSGYFGRNCGAFCDGCISYICDKTDGLCKNTTGCEPGFIYQEFCNKTCDDGYFGDNCTRKCNCLTGICNSITGKCPEDESQSRSKETSNAAAIGGGVAAFIIVVLIIVAAFILYRRRLISTQDGVRTTSSDTTTYENRNTPNNSNRNEQQYDDLIRMETTSPYQDLTTPSVSNEYEQIDNAYVNLSLQI